MIILGMLKRRLSSVLAFLGFYALVAPREALSFELWENIRNSTWYEENGWTGGSVEFFEDGSGRPVFRHKVFGSGIPVISNDIGSLRINGLDIQFEYGSEPKDSGIRNRDYRYDPIMDLFISLTSCEMRLVRPGRKNEYNPYLDESATWKQIHNKLKTTQKPTVIREGPAYLLDSSERGCVPSKNRVNMRTSGSF